MVLKAIDAHLLRCLGESRGDSIGRDASNVGAMSVSSHYPVIQTLLEVKRGNFTRRTSEMAIVQMNQPSRGGSMTD